MKPTLPILAGLLAVVAPLGAQNIKIDIDPNKSAEPAAATAPAALAAPSSEASEIIVPADGKYSNVQKMEMYGFILSRRMGLLEQVSPLVETEEELLGFLRGFGAAMTGGQLPYDNEKLLEQSQELIRSRTEVVNAKIEKAVAEMKAKNSKEAADFLAKLDSKAGVKKTSSGLRYEIVQDGKGAKAKPEQAVIAAYKASFIDGTVFDTSEKKEGKVEFALASAIPGLKEGFQLVGVGGKMKLYIPAELGFGDAGPLPPGVLTIFEVEVLEIKEPTKQPAAQK